MGSALLNPAVAQEFAGVLENVAPSLLSPRADHAAPVPATVEDLRREVAERLAAHRRRRSGSTPRLEAAPSAQPVGTRSARIAAAVAERYAHSPSYREVLAAEAERATQQARAAAEVAAQNAYAIAVARQRLLAAYDEHLERASETQEFSESGEAVAMELWPEPEAESAAAAPVKRAAKVAARDAAPATPVVDAPVPSSGAGITVRLYEDAACAFASPESFRASAASRYAAESSAAEAMALDEEIAFRHAPVFEEPAGPPVALPANLIEFPRQLIAARKARPRYAEGPLRDEADAAPDDGQLRIFEVDPAQISTAPEASGAETAQWTSIWLDAPVAAARAAWVTEDDVADEAVAVRIEPASLGRRAAAAGINFGIVATGTIAFTAMAGFTLAHLNGIAWPVGVPLVAGVRQVAVALSEQAGLQAAMAGIVAAAAGAFLLLVYQALFFVCSTATPGMRAVRIAFCTFGDESPTRAAIRRRMWITLLSLVPLGMGFAWAALDEERLTWHDRISRIYLRRY